MRKGVEEGAALFFKIKNKLVATYFPTRGMWFVKFVTGTNMRI